MQVYVAGTYIAPYTAPSYVELRSLQRNSTVCTITVQSQTKPYSIITTTQSQSDSTVTKRLQSHGGRGQLLCIIVVGASTVHKKGKLGLSRDRLVLKKEAVENNVSY